MIEIDFVEQMGEELHFSMSISYEEAEAILSKGSIEDRHAEALFDALKYAFSRIEH